MARGQKTGGRVAGSLNKRTLELQDAMKTTAEKIKEVLGEGTFEGDGHAMLMAVYKSPDMPINIRIDAAKAAIGYEKPKLSSGNLKLENPLGDLLDAIDGATRGIPSGTRAQ